MYYIEVNGHNHAVAYETYEDAQLVLDHMERNLPNARLNIIYREL